MHLSKPAFLSKGRVLEIVWLNRKVRRDMVVAIPRQGEATLTLIVPSSILALASGA